MIREEISAGLAYLGVQLNPERDTQVAPEPTQGTQGRAALREMGATGCWLLGMGGVYERSE